MKLLRQFLIQSTLSVAAMFCQANAQVPQIINYQGRIASGGAPFTGAGQFKFALVSNDASTSFWSNDGTSTAGSEPTGSVSLPVAAGLYVAPLGDPAIPGMAALPPSVFANAGVNLRVWFDDGTNGSQLLAPDQRVLSVAYAMMAAGVQNSAITTAMIAPGAVTPDKLAADSSIPPGAVIAFAGITPPAGFLMCDGRSYNKADYPALAAVLNTTGGAAFGGTAGANGTFNTPDLRGRFLRGADDPDGTGSNFTNAGRDPDSQPSTNGGADGKRYASAVGGNLGNLVGSMQNAAFASHSHGPGSYATNSAGSHVHTTPASANSYLTPGGTGGNVARTGSAFGGEQMNPAGDHSHTVNSGSSSSAGGSETRPANAYVNYIIKF